MLVNGSACDSFDYIFYEVFFFRYDFITNFSWTPNPIFAFIKEGGKNTLEKKRISWRERVSWTNALCTVSCEGPFRVLVWRFFRYLNREVLERLVDRNMIMVRKFFFRQFAVFFSQDTPEDESMRGTEEPRKVIDGIFPSCQHDIVRRTRRFY